MTDHVFTQSIDFLILPLKFNSTSKGQMGFPMRLVFNVMLQLTGPNHSLNQKKQLDRIELI